MSPKSNQCKFNRYWNISGLIFLILHRRHRNSVNPCKLNIHFIIIKCQIKELLNQWPYHNIFECFRGQIRPWIMAQVQMLQVIQHIKYSWSKYRNFIARQIKMCQILQRKSSSEGEEMFRRGLYPYAPGKAPLNISCSHKLFYSGEATGCAKELKIPTT